MRSRLRLLVALVLGIALAAPGLARAGRVELRVDSAEIHVGLPFVLSVAVSGLEEQPEPVVPTPVVAGCRVTPLGMTPNVSSMVTIVNGQRSETRNVTFVYRYRVEAPAPGRYTIAPVTVEQGATRLTSRPASFTATDVPASPDMRLAVTWPERPVSIGETFEIGIDWYLRREVSGQTFAIPILGLAEWLEVRAAPGDDPRRQLEFPAGGATLALPYERDTTTLDGVEYTRFRFRALATPIRAGVVDVPASRVLAQVEIGVGRDSFGFPVPRTQLQKAEDRARRLEVRALPQAGQPKSFRNAVGTSFSIDVQADRTIVRVGDPIELRIHVRGDARLDGLILPSLADAGLPAELFSAPDESPPGEVVADPGQPGGAGQGRRFRVSVRVRSEQVTEIPPLAFSYYDPATDRYQTVRSQPIALSVKGSAVVGAGDVVSAGSGRAPGAAAGPGGGASPAAARGGSAVGADLVLSQGPATLATVRAARDVAPALVGLYLLPLLALGWLTWRRRTDARRQAACAARDAARAVEGALDDAADRPAREAAPRVVAALRALGRALGRPVSELGPLVERLETESYDPRGADRPLDAALRDRVRDEARRWARAGSRSSPGPRAGAAAVALLAGAGLLAAGPAGGAARAHAAPPPYADGLAAARAAYGQALAETDRERRVAAFARAEELLAGVAAFARAEELLAEAAGARPRAPELLADWGNAALGAGELGKAALAYRRALALDPRLDRARRNLAWVRAAMPDWLPRPQTGAMDSLLFWHRSLSVLERLLGGGVAFAAAVLLAAPFAAGADRRRLLRRLALFPAAVWLALTASALAERDGSRDAVLLTDAVILRSADSPGAPPVLPQPLPAGAELAVSEVRGAWSRACLADGTCGWLPEATIAFVEPRGPARP